ncbi:hypothetical protein GCM10009555_033250 [Acrocarpospora macrocephala]
MEITQDRSHSLVHLFHKHLPAEVGPMAKVKRRRWPILVSSLVALAAVALVAAQLVTVPSAQATVVAAAELTATESFRSHVVTTQETPDSPPFERVVDGFFNPATRYGRAQVQEPKYEMLFIGDTIYSRLPADLPKEILAQIPAGKQWVAAEKQETRGPLLALVKQSFQDPAAALQQLKSANDVVETSPGHYAFKLIIAEGIDQSLTGTVEVDDQGRVRKLEITVGALRTVLEFRDYGTQEPELTAPPEAETAAMPAALSAPIYQLRAG